MKRGSGVLEDLRGYGAMTRTFRKGFQPPWGSNAATGENTPGEGVTQGRGAEKSSSPLYPMFI